MYPDEVKEMNNVDSLPLHLAARRNTLHSTYLQLLSAYPDSASAKYPNGDLPIHWVCKHADFEEAISVFIDNFADTRYPTSHSRV